MINMQYYYMGGLLEENIQTLVAILFIIKITKIGIFAVCLLKSKAVNS